MKTIELIKPKTGKRRMVPTEGSSAENRLACLKRAGFVPVATYKAPKKKVEKPEPTLAEKVKKEAVKVEVDGVELEAEIAVHDKDEGEAVALEDYTKAKLVVYAADIGADVKKSWKKDKIVDTIKAHLVAEGKKS